MAALGWIAFAKPHGRPFREPCINRGRPRRAAPTVRPEILARIQKLGFSSNFWLASVRFSVLVLAKLYVGARHVFCCVQTIACVLRFAGDSNLLAVQLVNEKFKAFPGLSDPRSILKRIEFPRRHVRHANKERGSFSKVENHARFLSS